MMRIGLGDNETINQAEAYNEYNEIMRTELNRPPREGELAGCEAKAWRFPSTEQWQFCEIIVLYKLRLVWLRQAITIARVRS